LQKGHWSFDIATEPKAARNSLWQAGQTTSEKLRDSVSHRPSVWAARVERAVEADAVGRLAHADVLAVRAQQRLAAAEVSGAQAAIDRHDDGRLRAVQQIGPVVPLG
jgi:phage gp37-like protein